MKRCKRNISIILISSLSLCVGCSLPRNPVPLAQLSNAKLVDIQDVRAQGDQYSELFQKDLVESIRHERKEDFPLNPDGSTSYSILSLSGGGVNGAFGAGFLSGWTQTGTRPKFKLVTGISTGSLIAPLAFLGPEYDDKLKEAYTTITPEGIFKAKGLISILSGESFGDSTPLQDLIASQVNEGVLKAIADEHAKGRRLYVGTTDLDQGRFIVWNMGAIAASGHPDSLELFKKVLLASSSIPGGFPPVYFDVEVDGKVYDEMHVDGGTMTQVFFYGGMLDLPAARKEIFGENAPESGSRIYIIRNGKLRARSEQVQRKLTKIIGRSLSVLTKSQAIGDLYRVYTITQRDGIDFNYVDMPDDYEPISMKSFDEAEMKRLFEFGFEMGVSGDNWQKLPSRLKKIEPVQ